MAKKFWWPNAMADQQVLVQNFRNKISTYSGALGFSADDLEEIDAVCNSYLQAFTIAEQARATMLAMTQWRDLVFNGTPAGGPAPAPPSFLGAIPIGVVVGAVKLLLQWRERIVASAGYTQAIGEDLGIVGSEITPPAPSTVKPVFKQVVTTGYNVSLQGSMQGMTALRVEYAPEGGNFAPVAFLTNTPGSFQITPAEPGQPEKGRIRAVYIKKNGTYGTYSADYPVTVS